METGIAAMQEEANSSKVGQTESKHTEISKAPLSCRPAAGFKMILVAREPNCLELRPSGSSLFLHGIAPLIFLFLIAQLETDWWWVLAAVLLVIIEWVRILRAIFRSWVRFDRKGNLLTLGRSFLSINHPLKDVIAVQLLKETLWLGFYQLNLVLAHPTGRRVNLYAFWKSNLVAKAGQDIANFLGVPLLDEIQGEKA
jgi:hypothetical protein